ncbi:MAG: DUF1189 family protein [Acidobacteriota bacterium]
MLRYFPRQLYLAISDFEFYKRVFQQPLRETLLFLLYLAGLVAIVLTLIDAWWLFPAIDSFVAWGKTNLPPFEVTEGTLKLASVQPIVKHFDGPNDAIWTFIFDTSGTYTEPLSLEEPALLFARKDLTLRFEGKSQSYSWGDFGEFSFEPSKLGSYGTFLKWSYFPLAYSFLLIFSLLAKPLTALVLSPLAYSVGLSYGIRLPFLNCFTIALYSLVPAIAIDLAVRMTGMEISYFDLIYLAAAAVYTFFATQRCVVAH